MMTDTYDDIRILLLAAGAATRFGSAKQMAVIDGIAMVRHCAQNAVDSGARVLVVSGAYRDEVERHLRDVDLTSVHNADWSSGLGSSIACGIGVAARSEDVRAAIVLLADQPMVSADNLRELIAQHRQKPDRIIAASANDAITPPCLFPRAYFAELQALRAQTGARELIRRHSDRVVAVAMPNAAVDIDTVEAYAQFCASRA
jgi:molybdenum cofactor cytidylyltransferase